MPRLLKFLVFLAFLVGTIGFLCRGPDFAVEFEREVPSKHSAVETEQAIKNPKNWTVFFHSLKEVKDFRGSIPYPLENANPGNIVEFTIEPKGKEWKRRVIRAQMITPRTGESLRFRLLSESSGKTEKMLGNIEWWLAFRPATGKEIERGFQTVVFGGVSAQTKTARSRFFGRTAETILMNQIYPIDLVKLANYGTVLEARESGTEPVYK
jgi:hypothetical protein